MEQYVCILNDHMSNLRADSSREDTGLHDELAFAGRASMESWHTANWVANYHLVFDLSKPKTYFL